MIDSLSQHSILLLKNTFTDKGRIVIMRYRLVDSGGGDTVEDRPLHERPP